MDRVSRREQPSREGREGQHAQQGQSYDGVVQFHRIPRMASIGKSCGTSVTRVEPRMAWRP